MNKEQYKVEIPKTIPEDKLKKWCNANLTGKIKRKWYKRYDEKKKKWVRDYSKPIRFRFSEESDAMAFRLMWEESK